MYTFEIKPQDDSWSEFLNEDGWLTDQESKTYSTAEAAEAAAQETIKEMEGWVADPETGSHELGWLIFTWRVTISHDGKYLRDYTVPSSYIAGSIDEIIEDMENRIDLDFPDDRLSDDQIRRQVRSALRGYRIPEESEDRVYEGVQKRLGEEED